MLTGITWTRGGTTLRALSYTYDVFGNLRTSGNGSTTESFAYDALQRLTTATRVGGVNGTVSYGYDAAGNLQRKTDFSLNSPGAYQYTGGSCGGGPNAVKSVQLATGGTRTYCYDAAGNLTSDNAGFVARYDATQRPLQITRSANTTLFDYRPDGERFRQTGSVTRHYFPGVERDAATERTTIGATLITHQGGQRLIRTLLLDRLGSVEAVADGTGLLETRSFDAFGKPRQGSYADANPARLPTNTNTPRGFTGHEHLDTVDVIHMNGRAYDPALGRFLGVDPIIQFPTNSQSLNPYSYILNNPLSGRDPTGYASQNCESDPDCNTEPEQPSRKGEGVERIKNFGCRTGCGQGAASGNGAAGQGSVAKGDVNPEERGAASRREETAATGHSLQRLPPGQRPEQQTGDKVTWEEYKRAGSDFRVVVNKLLDSFDADPAETPEEAAYRVGDALALWTGRHGGLEAGANIVPLGNGKYGVDDFNFSHFGDRGVLPVFNPNTIYDVHTHPYSSNPRFSGWSQVINGVESTNRGSGDIGIYMRNGTPGLVFQAWDRTVLKFDYHGYKAAMDAAILNGGTADYRKFVTKER